jgi:hypothetical protein
MEMIDYMRNIEDFSLKNLEDKLREIIKNIIFLSEYWPLTDNEINNNNLAFQWYHKMPEILKNNKLTIENKTQEFQDALKGK